MTTEEFNEFLECEGVIYFDGNERIELSPFMKGLNKLQERYFEEKEFKQWQDLATNYGLVLTYDNGIKIEHTPDQLEKIINMKEEKNELHG